MITVRCLQTKNNLKSLSNILQQQKSIIHTHANIDIHTDTHTHRQTDTHTHTETDTYTLTHT